MFGFFEGKKDAKPLVLHVDDEQDIRELVAVILKGSGVTVVGAADATEGLSAAKRLKPKLILLDIAMPGMDGFDLCRKLKTETGLKTVPILMVTAMDQMKHVERALSAGADGYITKPFAPEKVRAKVAELLKLPSAQ